MDKRGLPGLCQPEDHPLPIGKHPDIPMRFSDTDLRFIRMNKWALQETRRHGFLRLSIITSKTPNKIRYRRHIDFLVKLFLQRFDDTVIGQPECHTLINDPCLESMPIELIDLQCVWSTMRIDFLAYLTVFLFQTIVGYNFLCSVSRRDNINNCSL